MTTALLTLAGLYVAYRIGRRVGRAQGFLAAALIGSLDGEDEGTGDHLAAQREAAPWQ